MSMILHHVCQFSKWQNPRWEALNQCFPIPSNLDSVEWSLYKAWPPHACKTLFRSSFWFTSAPTCQTNRTRAFFFHVHDNPDLPWWNLTLSASISADVAANQWWVLFPAPGAASQAVPRPFICVITVQRVAIRHTVRVTSLSGMWALKRFKDYTKGHKGVCICISFLAFKLVCVSSWERAVECQNRSSPAQTLLAALHSNQIAHHEAQRVSALKFSQVKSHVGWS